MSEQKVTLFEWTARPEPNYGNHGKVYMCYVADMHIGSVRVAKDELLSKASVVCVMHKRTDQVWRCPDGVEQGKAWVQKEFMEWFMALNKLAWGYMRAQQESKGDAQG
jgi:hypothetical protein